MFRSRKYRSLQNPFNNWTKPLVQQGFTWRPGSAGFRALDDGDTEVTVNIYQPGATIAVNPAAIRAIQVPFHVTEENLEVASISDSHPIRIPPACYLLVFQTGLSDQDAIWAHFDFYISEKLDFAILKADPDLSPPAVLITNADPA